MYSMLGIARGKQNNSFKTQSVSRAREAQVFLAVLFMLKASQDRVPHAWQHILKPSLLFHFEGLLVLAR